jgi:hypothetical protein
MGFSMTMTIFFTQRHKGAEKRKEIFIKLKKLQTQTSLQGAKRLVCAWARGGDLLHK